MKLHSIFCALLVGAVTISSCKKDKSTTPEPTKPETTTTDTVKTVVPARDTTLNGGEVSGVWKAGITVTVNGQISIPADKTLTIEEGVTVLMNDTAIGQEIIVKGNLYCKGTAEKPINITVPTAKRQTGSFPRIWGGIICAPTCKELLLLYTHIEYTGYVTTETSPSVLAGLFKAAAGEGLPAVNFRNETDGKVVIKNCTFNNCGEDGLYLEGGQFIIANNTFYTTGETGGDAINLKAGSIADVSFNLVYSPNTNALKLSNSGDRTPQCNPVCYNNTIVNCGWRRPKVKGGGVWLEEGVNAVVYNTLHVNCRFAVKNSKADERSIYDYSYYYGYTKECVDNFQAGVADVVRGAHDVAGTTAQSNDPKLENYPLDNSQTNADFSTAWDFHLKSDSPALTGAFTGFTPHYSATGLTLAGISYTSPAPAAHYGAYGVK